MGFGYELSGTNSAFLGFKYVSDDSEDNYLSLGLYDVDEVLNINGAGNVGIGTSSPSEKLAVDGSVIADEYLYNSDRRLKKNIIPLENYRDILKIDAVRFD
jgi:hypothetical protein